jgi:cobalt-zinc-cadmium efflux system membrane fusion protein
MYATVQIRTAAGGSGRIVVPEVAVQEVNGAQVVFVAGSQPGRFTVRPVTVGSPAGEGRLAITQGLRAGERVVGKGAFQLKAELTKASFGEEG